MFNFRYFNLRCQLKNCDVMMSTSKRGRKHSSIYLLNRNFFGHETRPTNIVVGNIFMNQFA